MLAITAPSLMARDGRTPRSRSDRVSRDGGLGGCERVHEDVQEIPPQQKAASFTIDQAMERMESVGSGALH